MSRQYEMKFKEIGPESEMGKELNILNRIIRWSDNGLEYEADQRHAEAIIQGMGVEHGKSLSTPGVSETNTDDLGEKVLLCSTDSTTFRSLCARLNFLAQDRSELQFISKCILSLKYLRFNTEGH